MKHFANSFQVHCGKCLLPWVTYIHSINIVRIIISFTKSHEFGSDMFTKSSDMLNKNTLAGCK